MALFLLYYLEWGYYCRSQKCEVGCLGRLVVKNQQHGLEKQRVILHILQSFKARCHRSVRRIELPPGKSTLPPESVIKNKSLQRKDDFLGSNSEFFCHLPQALTAAKRLLLQETNKARDLLYEGFELAVLNHPFLHWYL